MSSESAIVRTLGSGIDIFLQPGEWYFGDADTRIRTTLGSCVAITLWHPVKKLGGMCHYMLPARSRKCSSSELDGRYADEALRLLQREAQRVGTQLSDYEAKLFGGGNMLAIGSSPVSVPERNIAVGRALMQLYGLQVKAESLGGQGYRQLIFDIATGDVWVRRGGVSVGLNDMVG